MSPFEAGCMCCPPPGLPTVHLVHLLRHILSVVGSVFQYHRNGEGWSEDRREGAELGKKINKNKTLTELCPANPTYGIIRLF